MKIKSPILLSAERQAETPLPVTDPDKRRYSASRHRLLALLLLTGLTLSAAPPAQYLMERPPTPDEIKTWSFNDTKWLSSRGHSPKDLLNIDNVGSWHGHALQVDSLLPAFLQYQTTEANGLVNLDCQQGAISFWFKPWDSLNAGGFGPGTWSRLIEVGAWTVPPA